MAFYAPILESNFIFQSFGYPSREAVIERIQTYRDNLLAEAA